MSTDTKIDIICNHEGICATLNVSEQFYTHENCILYKSKQISKTKNQTRN